MEPFEIMVSESQERMLCVVEPERVDEVLAVCARWEVNATAIGEVTDSGRLRVFDGGDAGRRPAGRRARRRVPALRPRARARRRGRSTRRRRACSPTSRRRRRCCSRCSASPTSPRAGRCSSSTTASSARARCAGPSRPTPPCWCSTSRRRRPRDRGLDRRQRPPRGVRPVPRRGRGGARVRGEPRLRRRRAARPDQLPELRQPREAAHRLAARRARSPGSATPAARSACRSSAATSRSTTRAPTARSTRRRSSAWSASCPTPRAPGRLGFAARGRRGRAVAGASWAPSLRGSELAKLRGEPLGRRRCRRPTSASCARCTRRVREAVRARRAALARTTSPRAASRSRWPSAASPAALGAAVDARRGRRGAAVRRGPGRVRRLRPGRGARARSARRARARRGRRRRARRSGARRRASRWPSSPRVHADGLAA